MFVLLFAYVFGGSIELAGDRLPRVPHRRDLRPDRHLRRDLHRRRASPTTCRRASSTGSGRCRCRARRCSSAAPRSDVVNNVLSSSIMSLTGLLVGWRIRESVLEARRRLRAAAALRLRHLVGHGLRRAARPSAEVVNNASFIVIFPLTFIANTFVPTDDFPASLRTIAEWNPVSAVTQADARAVRQHRARRCPVPTRGRCSTRCSTRCSGSSSSWPSSSRWRSGSTSGPSSK